MVFDGVGVEVGLKRVQPIGRKPKQEQTKQWVF